MKTILTVIFLLIFADSFNGIVGHKGIYLILFMFVDIIPFLALIFIRFVHAVDDKEFLDFHTSYCTISLFLVTVNIDIDQQLQHFPFRFIYFFHYVLTFLEEKFVITCGF